MFSVWVGISADGLLYNAIMATVLVIEDERELSRVLAAYLEQAGYTVLTADRGDSGLSSWQHNKPDMVLLDLNLPGMDGLDVARAIRRAGDTPLIMVTARVEEIDRLIGLELGADDYITKPFSPREVVARVKTVLRRAGAAEIVQQIIRIANLEIDLDAFSVRQNGNPISLTPTEFRILAAMAGQPGRVFSRMQLLEASQGEAYEGYERTIDAHVKNLRQKLAHTGDTQYIETVFGVGYRFSSE
jgi:two-component system alkaline phosphatase synthesis response regulator PhoP